MWQFDIVIWKTIITITLFVTYLNQEYVYVCNHHMDYCNVVLLIFFTTFTDCATSLNVRFNSPAYNSIEGDVLQPGLVLSELSSTAITVQVITDDITATGEYTDIIINSVTII